VGVVVWVADFDGDGVEGLIEAFISSVGKAGETESQVISNDCSDAEAHQGRMARRERDVEIGKNMSYSYQETRPKSSGGGAGRGELIY
jgi:hypothetical protein